MKIINVIEVVDGTILSVDSIVIPDDSQEKERVAVAEKLFSDKAKENGASENDMEDLIEDGNYVQGDYSVFLTWSDLK